MIVVVNHNTCEELRNFLVSLGVWRNKTIVVDNASTDGSAEMVRSSFPAVELVRNSVNIGYGAAANQIFRSHPAAANANYLLLSNTDILVQPNSVEALVAELESEPTAGIAGPLLRNGDGSLQRSCFALPGSSLWMLDNDVACAILSRVPAMRGALLRAWEHDSPRSVPWIKGAFLLIRRSAFEEVGGFDESYFMYYEETDLCLRLGRLGWSTRFTPASVVVHFGGASTTKVRASMQVEQFISCIWFACRHYSRTRTVLLWWLWKQILWFRLMRDQVRLLTSAPDPTLAGDVAAWRAALALGLAEVQQRRGPQ